MSRIQKQIKTWLLDLIAAQLACHNLKICFWIKKWSKSPASNHFVSLDRKKWSEMTISCFLKNGSYRLEKCLSKIMDLWTKKFKNKKKCLLVRTKMATSQNTCDNLVKMFSRYTKNGTRKKIL